MRLLSRTLPSRSHNPEAFFQLPQKRAVSGVDAATTGAGCHRSCTNAEKAPVRKVRAEALARGKSVKLPLRV